MRPKRGNGQIASSNDIIFLGKTSRRFDVAFFPSYLNRADPKALDTHLAEDVKTFVMYNRKNNFMRTDSFSRVGGRGAICRLDEKSELR